MKTLPYSFIFFFLIFSRSLPGQSVPAPGAAQDKTIILRNATLHLGNGKTIEKGDLVFSKGKIMEVGSVTQNYPTAEEIDLNGKHVYPGLIATNTQIGLNEIEAVRSTRDNDETGAINPNARSLIAYNTDSRVTPTLRSNGILIAQIVPTGGLVSGTSSVVQLDAWNWEDAAYQTDNGVHLWWPWMGIQSWPGSPAADEQKEKIAESLQKIEQLIQDARAYHKAKIAGKLKESDLRWEAMTPVLEGKTQLFIHADAQKQMGAVIEFVLRHKLKAVLVGAADARFFTRELIENNIPVILRKTHSLPRNEDDPVDFSFTTPKMLEDAGVLYCLSSEGFWDQRNLPFLAGTAAAYGLTKEQALRAISLNAAKILGMDAQTGSLEAGKDANLVVSKGDLLDMRDSQVELAFIQGRKIDLGNKQKDLYEKFRIKP